MINSDRETNYAEGMLQSGFPQSSLATRKFIPNTLGARNQLVQHHPHYERFLSDKHFIMEETKQKYYHQDTLTDEMELVIIDKLLKMKFYQNECVRKDSNPILTILSQLPLDFIVCTKDDYLESRISLAHLVFANGWSAHEAINRPFSYFHGDVTRNRKTLLPTRSAFLDRLIYLEDFHERVGAFSIQSNPRLNLNPLQNYDRLDPDSEELFLRFERQVIFGIPEIDSFGFIIGTHLIDMRTNPQFYAKAIKNMHPDAYIASSLKGVKTKVIQKLRGMKN